MTMSKLIFKNGTRAEIRRATLEDAARIADYSYAATSTGYFYLPDPQPSRQALERICTLPAHEGVTYVVETTAGDIIAYAFYFIVDSRYPTIAKPVFYVAEAYLDSGLSGTLIQRLVQQGLLRGIDEFQLRVDANNMAVINFVKRSGLPYELQHAGGSVELRIMLVHNAVQMHWLP